MTSALPTTRLIRRQSGQRGWMIGLGLTIAVNLLVVWVLSGLSQHVSEPPPTYPIRSIARVPPPDTPPPEPTVTPEAVPEMQITLPALDLPSLTATPALVLPSITNDQPIELTMLPPVFTPSAAPAAGIDTPIIATAPASNDQPARLPPGIASTLERFYPRSARLRGIEGESRIVVEVAADGSVTRVTVLSSTPPGIFDAAVVKALSSVRYQPARAGEQALASRVEHVLSWSLRGK